MRSTVGQFQDVLNKVGSNVLIHREDGGESCPCRTPEGFRDPAYHRLNPMAVVCNEQGFIGGVVEFIVKASIQPAVTGQSRAGRRANALLGEVQVDDKLGVFPCEWYGDTLNFDNWSDAGEDFILYDEKRYMVVAADKLPDVNGDANHHYECGLRLLKTARPS